MTKSQISEEIVVNQALNAIANERFLDNADHEYISARCLYQIGLRTQFYWCALHALEKYLKCILLFNRTDPSSPIGNGMTLKHFGHDLVTMLKECECLKSIGFELSTENKLFVEQLSRASQGANRYLSFSSTIGFESLDQLDNAVWEVRNWARDAHAFLQLFKQQSGKESSDPLIFYSEIGMAQLGMINQLERLQSKNVPQHLEKQSAALLTGNNFYVPFDGKPVPSQSRYCSSYVTVTDRSWANNSQVRAAVKRFVE